MTYRKVTFEEIKKLASSLRYWDLVQIDEICEGAIKFFGPDVVKIELLFEDVYNDSGYNFHPIRAIAYNEGGQEIDPPVDNDDYKLWFYSLEMGTESYDGGREARFVIDVKNKTLLNEKEIPELYFLE